MSTQLHRRMPVSRYPLVWVLAVLLAFTGLSAAAGPARATDGPHVTVSIAKECDDANNRGFRFGVDTRGATGDTTFVTTINGEPYSETVVPPDQYENYTLVGGIVRGADPDLRVVVTVDGVVLADETVKSCATPPPPPPDADGDGVPDGTDKCPGTQPGQSVGNDGCPVVVPPPPPADGDNDGVPNDKDACPNTPAGETVDANGCSASQRDDDNDGVNNGTDKCPGTQPGQSVGNDGCPVVVPPPPPADGDNGGGDSEEPEVKESELTWTGNGSENASLNCPAGQTADWHWILTPGGNNRLVSARLFATYESGATTETAGATRGNGNGALYFDVTRPQADTVKSASVEFTYKGDGGNFVLTISSSECQGEVTPPPVNSPPVNNPPVENPPVVVPPVVVPPVVTPPVVQPPVGEPPVVTPPVVKPPAKPPVTVPVFTGKSPEAAPRVVLGRGKEARTSGDDLAGTQAASPGLPWEPFMALAVIAAVGFVLTLRQPRHGGRR